ERVRHRTGPGAAAARGAAGLGRALGSAAPRTPGARSDPGARAGSRAALSFTSGRTDDPITALEPLPREFVVAAWGAFGLVVGSCLNVAIHRLPREGESVFWPLRSRCPNCRHELGALENIPVVSWLVLRGRCKACRWPIPLRYPLVELLNAALWALTGALE